MTPAEYREIAKALRKRNRMPQPHEHPEAWLKSTREGELEAASQFPAGPERQASANAITVRKFRERTMQNPYAVDDPVSNAIMDRLANVADHMAEWAEKEK